MTKMSPVLLQLFLICLVLAQEDEAPLESKECRERDRLVTSDKEDLYSLVDVVEGQTLKLRCRFCKEEAPDQPRNWFKVARLGLSKPQEVHLDMNNDLELNRVQTNHKHTLIIKNISIEDTGFYTCLHYEDQSNKEKFNYLVDLVFPDNTTVERGKITDWSRYHDDFFASINNLFKQSDAREFAYLREALTVDSELATQWAPWGECEACGRPQGEGLMKKTGKCRIKLRPFGAQPHNLSEAEMYFFKAPAISCRSKRLSRIFPRISDYTRKIPDFVLEDRCSGACNPDAEGSNAGWKVGKGKGFKYRKHSVLQEGSFLTFVCPEATLDNKVVWKKTGRALKRGDRSNPHVIVDTFNTLYLVEVTKEDAGNYTCYVDDLRMQQVVVFVYSKSKIFTRELLRYLVYLGFVLFLYSSCYCAGLAMTWQRRHLFKTYQELKEEDPSLLDSELEQGLL